MSFPPPLDYIHLNTLAPTEYLVTVNSLLCSFETQKKKIAKSRLPPVSLLLSIVLSIPRPIIHPSTRLAVYSTSTSFASTCTGHKRARTILWRLVLVPLSPIPVPFVSTMSSISISLGIPLSCRITRTLVVLAVGPTIPCPSPSTSSGTSHQWFYRRTRFETPLQSRLGRCHARHLHPSG